MSLPLPPSSWSMPPLPSRMLSRSLPMMMVGEIVAGAVVGSADKRQILDIGAERVVEGRDDRVVDAQARGLDNPIPLAVEDVGVAAEAAGQAVVAGTAVERIVAVARRRWCRCRRGPSARCRRRCLVSRLPSELPVPLALTFALAESQVLEIVVEARLLQGVVGQQADDRVGAAVLELDDLVVERSR